MVDFQSRDTRRGLGGDHEDEEENEAEGEGESETESGAESEVAREAESEAATETDGEVETEAESGTEPEGETHREDADGADTAPAQASEDAADGEAADAVTVPEGMTYALVTVGSPAGTIDPADAAVPALDGTEARVVTRRSVEASFDAVQSTVGDLAERPDVAAVVTFGGVGVGPDDVTPGAVEPLFDKRMDGFGELYRVLAHEREGTAVVRARVTAGLVGPVPVFCLPGDPDAARHGLESLVVAEAEAVVGEAAGDGNGGGSHHPGDA